MMIGVPRGLCLTSLLSLLPTCSCSTASPPFVEKEKTFQNRHQGKNREGRRSRHHRRRMNGEDDSNESEAEEELERIFRTSADDLRASCWSIFQDEGADSQSNSSNVVKDGNSSSIYEEFRHHLSRFPVGGSKVEVREECWDGFDVSVVPPKDEFLRVDTPYEFKVNINVRQEIPSTFNGVSNQTSDVGPGGLLHPLNVVHVRLILCNVKGSGICTPYATTEEINSGLSDEALDQMKNSGEGLPMATAARTTNSVLHVVPPNKKGRQKHVSTPYITTVLQPTMSLEEEGSQVRVTVDGNRVEGVVDQTATLSLSLNVESLDDRKARTFLVMGHAILFRTDPTNHKNVVKRVDMAKSLPNQVVTYQDPQVLMNSLGFKIFLGILLGGFACAELFLFFSVLRHRNSRVMILSQAPLLALMVLAAVLATVSCSFVMPISDIFCNLCEPMIVIPLTLIGCILVGRIWRINAVLAPALKLGGEGEKSQFEERIIGFITKILTFLSHWENVCFFCGGCWYRRKSNGVKILRTNVSVSQLEVLVASIAFPQFVLQILSAALNPAVVVEEFFNGYTIGKNTCQRQVWWPSILGFCLMALPYAVTIILAWGARKLPSLFNETSSIYGAAGIVCLVLAVGIPLLILTNSPSVSPDVTAFLFTALVLSTCVTPCWFIVVPKLKLVWRGEIIVVSKLLRSGKSTRDMRSGDSLGGNSGSSGHLGQNEEHEGSTVASRSRGISGLSQEEAPGDSKASRAASGAESSPDEGYESADSDIIEDTGSKCSFSTKSSLKRAQTEPSVLSIAKGKRRQRRISLNDVGEIMEIDPTKPLPSRLERNLLVMKQLLTRITGRFMVGIQISPNDLEELKSKGKDFGDMCTALRIKCREEQS